ncbi:MULTISPECIES: methyltransferase [Desulfobacula]|uniref:O-methyltransferase, family II n=2 Tax=Desulfobacula TaxID=28222 RepID=K0NN65_DESTT|nr:MULTISPECIES: class I SAM-dependent methyltransferase [Desulfobacula]CCK81453.1 O-methyltransferase, family II [Desulfobacula toluolica Tol2]SDU29382.1 Ubiquinone/menaquinone biosynthesis C-methylase UbiE [Desulfobacula phenolica]
MKKSLPTDFPELNYHELPYIAIRWETVKTALQLGLFDLLPEPQSASDIAVRVECDAKNTEYLLNALTALGYLYKKDGLFCNTEQTERFLTSRGDTGLAESLLAYDQWNEPALNGRMLTLVKEGAPLSRDMVSEQVWADSARKSINGSRCGRAQGIARLLSLLPDFDQWQKVLDIGAGPGLIGIAVAAAHPTLECCLFDRPVVIDVAQETIKEYGMEDRVKTISGDYSVDPFGEGYDAIIASYTLNFYNETEKLAPIMEKCFAALNPGGSLIVFSDGLSEEKTQPTDMVISWLPTSLMGQDFSFEEEVLPRAMLAAGFDSVRTKTLTDQFISPLGVTEFHVGRKR